MRNLEVIKEQEVLGKEFKIFGDFENPLFLAKDVANWIEHNKPSEMISNVDNDEKLKAIISLSGQKREVWLLSEEGLYEVLMQSRKPIAKDFKKEVKKILKSIRKHGMYAIDELLDNPELLIQAGEKLKQEKEKNRILEMEKQKLEVQNEQKQELIIEMKPKVDFAETLLKAEDSILVRDFSKVLEKDGIKIGQNKLFDWFKDNKYLMKNRTPYQAYMKYFTVIERTIDNGYTVKTTFTTKINPKGQYYFYKKIREHFNK